MPNDDASPEDAKLKRLAALKVRVDEFRSSEGFQAWLSTMAAFPSYSASNCMLLAAQMPTATHVCGYRKWQELGRQVRRGEKALHIIGPLIRKNRETGDPELYGFKVLNVFDVSQTEGEELPPPPAWPTIDVPVEDGLLDTLVGWIEAAGISVSRADGTDDGPRGWYSDRRITVVAATESGPRSDSQQILTLLHELGHAFDPGLRDSPRHERELVAESVKWLCAHHLGLDDPDDQTLSYLSQWGGAEADLLRLGERIVTAAKAVEREVVLRPPVEAAA